MRYINKKYTAFLCVMISLFVFFPTEIMGIIYYNRSDSIFDKDPRGSNIYEDSSKNYWQNDSYIEKLKKVNSMLMISGIVFFIYTGNPGCFFDLIYIFPLKKIERIPLTNKPKNFLEKPQNLFAFKNYFFSEFEIISLCQSLDKQSEIKKYINDGAASFLVSYSHFLMAMNYIELSEIQKINIENIKMEISKSIQSMRKTQKIYSKLIKQAEISFLNADLVESLKSFDYDAFLKKNKFKDNLYEKVKHFLSKGDMNGLYVEAQKRHSIIVSRLNEILQKLTSEDLQLGSQKVWDLLRLYSETLDIGKYAAQIINEILKEKKLEHI